GYTASGDLTRFRSHYHDPYHRSRLRKWRAQAGPAAAAEGTREGPPHRGAGGHPAGSSLWHHRLDRRRRDHRTGRPGPRVPSRGVPLIFADLAAGSSVLVGVASARCSRYTPIVAVTAFSGV